MTGEENEGDVQDKDLTTPMILVKRNFNKIHKINQKIKKLVKHLKDNEFEVDICNDLESEIKNLKKELESWKEPKTLENEKNAFVRVINIINKLKDLGGNVPFLDDLIKQFVKAVDAVIWDIEHVQKPNESLAEVSLRYCIKRKEVREEIRKNPCKSEGHDDIPHDVALHHIGKSQFECYAKELNVQYRYWKYKERLLSLREQALNAQIQTRERR